eukprot:gene24930-10581_t
MDQSPRRETRASVPNATWSTQQHDMGQSPQHEMRSPPIITNADNTGRARHDGLGRVQHSSMPKLQQQGTRASTDCGMRRSQHSPLTPTKPPLPRTHIPPMQQSTWQEPTPTGVDSSAHMPFLSLEEAFHRCQGACAKHVGNVLRGESMEVLASMALADTIVFELVRFPYFAKLWRMLKLLSRVSDHLRRTPASFGQHKQQQLIEAMVQGCVTYLNAVLFAALKLSCPSVNSLVDTTLEPWRGIRNLVLPHVRTLRMLMVESRMYSVSAMQSTMRGICSCGMSRQKARIKCNSLFCMGGTPSCLYLHADNIYAHQLKCAAQALVQPPVPA